MQRRETRAYGASDVGTRLSQDQGFFRDPHQRDVALPGERVIARRHHDQRIWRERDRLDLDLIGRRMPMM